MRPILSIALYKPIFSAIASPAEAYLPPKTARTLCPPLKAIPAETTLAIASCTFATMTVCDGLAQDLLCACRHLDRPLPLLLRRQ